MQARLVAGDDVLVGEDDALVRDADAGAGAMRPAGIMTTLGAALAKIFSGVETGPSLMMGRRGSLPPASPRPASAGSANWRPRWINLSPSCADLRLIETELGLIQILGRRQVELQDVGGSRRPLPRGRPCDPGSAAGRAGPAR